MLKDILIRILEKSGYYPQCLNFWKNGCKKINGGACRDCLIKSYKALKIDDIISHLKGNSEDCNDVIGIYPLFPNSTTRVLVFDFDDHDKCSGEQWKEEVDSLRQICKLNGLDPLVERSRSGSGAHIWIFFNKPIDASIVREFAFLLLEKGEEQISIKNYKYYDRMLPNQDYIDKQGLGNLIALPLQGQAVKKGNSIFVDENWNAYSDQMAVLFAKPKLSKEFIQEKIKEWSKLNYFSCTNVMDRIEPWKEINFQKSDVNGRLSIVLSNSIYIDTTNIAPRLQNSIRRLAAFSNPVFYKNRSIGISNYQTSSIIYLGRDHYNGYIEIPRGLSEQLIELCNKSSIEFEIIDERNVGSRINVTFIGELYNEQKNGLNKILAYDNGILNATTAYGKTVVCSALIASKKVNTLVILESSALIEQWKSAISNFIEFRDELPLYTTNSGKVKRRKEYVGVLHGKKDSTNGIIDIAMVGTLCRKGEFYKKIDRYGMIIVDECHHAASETMMKVLQRIKSKYVYGVTATQIRSDQLEKNNTMVIGPVRYKYSAKERNESMGIKHFVCPKFTRAVLNRTFNTKVHPNEAYSAISDNSDRNEMILNDIKECIKNGRTPIVLSKFKNHCENIYYKAKNYADHVFLLTGNNSKIENKSLISELKNVDDSETVLVIGTGSLIGEGFDYPRFDTLIMATPISFKGLVEQYAGRLNRNYNNKKDIIIYDYVDVHINLFASMYAKRMKAYKQMGYSILSTKDNEIQDTNFIFDGTDFFYKMFEDFKLANKTIVISSPYISNNRVDRLIKVVNCITSRNIKVVVLTLTPDSYLFGDASYWSRLHEDLRSTGIEVKLSNDLFEKYAIIDNIIVWFGNINILGKDKEEETIMRIVDKKIANELQYRLFNKDKKLIEF